MPLSNQIHVNKALENISVAYKVENLVADQFTSTVPVMHESDSYFVYTKDNFRLERDLRAVGGRAAEVSYNVSTSTYRLNEHALVARVPDRLKANADKAIRLDIEATEDLTGRIMLRREERLANLLTTVGSWSNTSLTSTLAWTQNTTLSDPLIAVDSASSVITQNSGKMPNTLLINHRTYLGAKEHKSVVDRIKYTSPESVGEALLARLFGTDRLLVGRAIRNTADENLTDTMAYIWSDVAVLAYVERSPGLRRPSAVYTMQKNTGGAGGAYRVRTWRDEETESDMIECSSMFQHRAIASDCAYLLVDTA